jgi:hypothetical protein
VYNNNHTQVQNASVTIPDDAISGTSNVYRVYADGNDSFKLKITSAYSNVGNNEYTLALIYNGTVIEGINRGNIMIYDGAGNTVNYLQDKSIRTAMLNYSYLNAYILSGRIDVNTTAYTITVTAGTIIATGEERYTFLGTDTVISYSTSPNPTYAKYLYFKSSSKTIEWSESLASSQTEDYAFLGAIWNSRILGAFTLQQWTVNSISNGGFGNPVAHTDMGMTYLSAFIMQGGIDINTTAKTISIQAGTICTLKGYFGVTATVLSYASSSNPTYAKYIYVNLNNNTIEWNDIFISSDRNKALLGILWNGRIWSAPTLQVWTVNGVKNGGFGNMLSNNEITFDNTAYKGYGYIGYTSNNAIEIDTVNKKFRVTSLMNIIYHHTAANIATQDWQTYSEPSIWYLKTVYIDLTDNTIKVSVNSNITNPHIILFHFTGYANVINSTIFGPIPNITGVTVNGSKTVENRPIYIGQLGYGNCNDLIEIDLVNSRIRLNSSLWVMSNGLNVNIAAHDWNPFVTGTNVNYVLVCYVDLATNKICIANHSVTLNNAIVLFRFQGPTATYKSHYSSSSFSVLINGASVLFSAGNAVSSSATFPWGTDKFIIPETLYLVAGLEYGINPQNFNFNKDYSTDLLDFEIPLPTRTEQFAKYGKINVPFSGDFLTKVVGKYRLDNTNALYKDILLKVKDKSEITPTSKKVIYIGDSIVNLPKTLKYWLGKFGITATMLGTINNEIDYGYGIQPPLLVEKGEGRGGWRLTDFAETTRYTEGTSDVLHSPFWNSSTSQLDFQYYLDTNSLEVPDIAIIALLTNDITGYHNKTGAIDETMDDLYNTIIERDLKTLVDMLLAVNPNMKIAINPPMSNGLDGTFTQNANKCAEREQLVFEDNAEYPNVYCLGSYLSSAWTSAPTYKYTSNPAPTQLDPNNKTMKTNFINNVHQNGMAQLQNALWVASWIANII